MSNKSLKKGNFFKKIAAVLSLFAISMIPVEAEAARPKKRISRVHVKKIRVTRAHSGRAALTRPVRGGIGRPAARVQQRRRVAQPLRGQQRPSTQYAEVRAQRKEQKARYVAAKALKAQQKAQQARLAANQAHQQAAAQQAHRLQAAQHARQLQAAQHARQLQAAQHARQLQAAQHARQQAAAQHARQQAAQLARQQAPRGPLQQLEASWQAMRQQYRNQWARNKNAFLNYDLALSKGNVNVMTGDSRNGLMAQNLVTRKVINFGYYHPHETIGTYGIGIPPRTIIAPYNMSDDTKGFDNPVFFVNCRLPYYLPDYGPEIMHRHLMDVDPNNITCSLVVQSMPYYADTLNHLLQVKPQGFLSQDALFQDPNPHNELYRVSVGLFPVGAGTQRLQEQVGTNLVENHPLSIHNIWDAHGNVTDPRLIFSGNTLNIHGLDTNRSQTFFTLTKHRNSAGILEAEINQLVLVTNRDGDRLSRIINRDSTNNFRALGRKIQEDQARPTLHARHFTDLNLNDIAVFQ